MSQLDIILEKAFSLKGSHDYDNYCQRFVRVCYEAAGIMGEASSASAAYAKWAVSDSMKNVPAGAAVYFKGIGSYGHVGIATDDGNIIHAANGVKVQSLDYCNKRYTFLGWGWQGGTRPEGASGKATASKSKADNKTASKKSADVSRVKTVEQLSRNRLTEYSGSIYGKLDSVGIVSNGYELLIENDKVYLPMIIGELVLEYKRQLAPTMLRFNVLKDNSIDFGEGSPVRLRVGGNDVFRGYVFEKERKDSEVIAVTAYDSLRYFKNKDTILYKGKKYSELLEMLLKDYCLKVGDICDTGYVIEKQLAEGTIFDILADAADITYTHTGKRYVLLDDFGYISLKNQSDMTTDIILNEDNIGSYSYTSTIDRDVYDYIQIVSDNKNEGVRNVYSISDSNTALWGRLQYYLKPNEELTTAQIKELAEGLLKRYSRKRRFLSLYDVKGDISIRGGSIVRVNMNLGDIVIDENMLCERVRHTFWGKSYLLDIDLYGREGEFDV